MFSVMEHVDELVAEGYSEEVAQLLARAEMLKRKKSALKNKHRGTELREERNAERKYPYDQATCSHPYKEW